MEFESSTGRSITDPLGEQAAKKEKKRRDYEKPFDFSKLPPEKLCNFIKMRRQAKTHGPGKVK